MILKGKNNQFFDAKKVIISKLESVYDPVNLIIKYFKVLNYSPSVDGYFLPVMVQKKVMNKFSLFKASVLVPDPDKAISYRTCREDFKKALVQISVHPTMYGEHSDKIGGCSAKNS